MIEHCHGYSTEIEVDVPCSVAYQCYSERETIPQWMPFISSVKVPVKLCSKYISSHFSSLPCFGWWPANILPLRCHGK
jgi:uncharacterized membrane protein